MAHLYAKRRAPDLWSCSWFTADARGNGLDCVKVCASVPASIKQIHINRGGKKLSISQAIITNNYKVPIISLWFRTTQTLRYLLISNSVWIITLCPPELTCHAKISVSQPHGIFFHLLNWKRVQRKRLNREGKEKRDSWLGKPFVSHV